jgi:hypothetical protein
VGTAGPTVSGTVTDRDIARFAVACGDEAPVGSAQGAPMLVPLLMLPSVIEWGAGPALHELRPDGTGVGREGWLPLDGLRLMGGGQDLEFHADVMSGREFTAVPRLDAVQLKGGGTGELLLLTITTVFRDEEGTDLLTCRDTLIGR